jgi:hypothetical protein
MNPTTTHTYIYLTYTRTHPLYSVLLCLNTAVVIVVVEAVVRTNVLLSVAAAVLTEIIIVVVVAVDNIQSYPIYYLLSTACGDEYKCSSYYSISSIDRPSLRSVSVCLLYYCCCYLSQDVPVVGSYIAVTVLRMAD